MDEHQKLRYKKYLRINIVSLFFIAVSFISVTLAWFAYSGLARTSIDATVKAWYIEFSKGNEEVSNDIVISLENISPGMETINEVVHIKNLGDSDAGLRYQISSARILDTEYVLDEKTLTPEELADKLSHDYPFHVNIELERYYVKALDDVGTTFEVSISWPLDGGTDEDDSTWGKQAYNFQKKEEDRKKADPSYEIRPAIKIEISVTAEQYIESNISSDFDYNLGDLIIFDVVNNKSCETVGGNCIITHVIDVNSTLGNNSVTLLPDVRDTYGDGTFSDYNNVLSTITAGWGATTRALTVQDLLRFISTDITNSVIVTNNLSDIIIGNLKYGSRMNNNITNVINSNAYYKYSLDKFSYLSTNRCYWTSSNYNTNGFAFKKVNETTGKLYEEDASNTCNIVPVIIASKANL